MKSNLLFLFLIMAFGLLFMIYYHKLSSEFTTRYFAILHHKDPVKQPRFYRATPEQLLEAYKLPEVLPIPKLRFKKLKPFDYVVNKNERFLFYKLLNIFHELLSENGVNWFMAGGTLLGSYRCHDFLPWDDDVDVYVNVADRTLVQEIVQNYSRMYYDDQLVLFPAHVHDKFYMINESTKLSEFQWKWPYIDVSYFRLNETYMYDIAVTYHRVFEIPKSIIFPLTTRPLFKYNFPAPKDSYGYLVWTYGYTDKCLINSYSHMLEGLGFFGDMHCKDVLEHRYGYVKRYVDKMNTIGDNGEVEQKDAVVEELIWRNKLMQRVKVNEPLYAICDEFSLTLKTDNSTNRKYRKMPPLPPKIKL